MKHLRKGLAATAAVTVVGVFALQSPTAVASPPPVDGSEAGASVGRADSLPHPLADKRRAAKIRALNALVSGDAQLEQRGRSTGVEVDGQFVETAVTGEDEIFVLLTEFGDQIHEVYGGEPGPRHNEIPEPDRTIDNTTIWQPDYDSAHYEKLYGETDDDSYPSLANFVEEQSGDKYTVRAEVSPWVQLDYNQARYGSNIDDTETYWSWVADSVNYWWAQNCTDDPHACNEVLAQYDVWDRYDYDEDGNFDEPDGYLDHFQLVHAGVGEETCGGTCPDAIWSHRWHVNLDDVGFEGPTVPGTGDQNLHGGAQIGDSPWWVGDYTAQPENGGLGVFAHEYMHDLELPDEYATDGIENDTGFWTLMSSGSYFSEHGDEAIGTRAAGLNIWDKAFLGWVTPEDGSLYIAQPGEQEVEIGPSAIRSNDLAQGAVVNLPERTLVVDTPDPVDGDWEWWSFYGDLLENTLTTTQSLDLSGASTAQLTADINYNIETDYDYLFGEISADGGLSWTRLNGTVDGEPIWGEDDRVHGLTGHSDPDTPQDEMGQDTQWVPLTYDMSEWAGESEVLFRYFFQSDGGTVWPGAFLDNITIWADDEAVLENGAEGDDDGPWTTEGFVKTSTEFIADYPQRYWVENRQLVGADSTYDWSPYNFMNAAEFPDLVEHFPYQTGPLVWYNWDAYGDNNVGSHPGVGLILPIDVQAEPLLWPDDENPATTEFVRNRIQPYDATLSLDPTLEITLHRPGPDGELQATTWGGLPPVSTFDDVNGTYWFEERPSHGVLLEPTGTQIELLAMNDVEGGVQSATIRIAAPQDVIPTTPPPTPTEPTPTLPPTGGDDSSTLAGIGLAAILAGGLLVAFAARRLRDEG